MMLDSTLRLEAVLSGAITTTQPDVHVTYVVWNPKGEKSKPAFSRVALNSTTDVTILAASTTVGEIREVLEVNIYNRDTASVTVTVKTDDGTERIIILQAIATLKTLAWRQETGWYTPPRT